MPAGRDALVLDIGANQQRPGRSPERQGVIARVNTHARHGSEGRGCSLSDRVLTIRGGGNEEKEIKEEDFHRRERSRGSLRRNIELPAVDVDEPKIVADFSKGVLTVQLPKTKEAQKRVKHIDVPAA